MEKSLKRKYRRTFSFTLIGMFALVSFIEGSFGILTTSLKMFAFYQEQSLKIAMYDKEIGWVPKKNVVVKKCFPNADVKTDLNGFRIPLVQSSKKNQPIFLYSGDSVTFGYGVQARESWPELLGVKNQHQVVNMSFPMYGIDQSYLFYKRYRKIQNHKVHIFAFISDDFERARFNSFVGIPKSYFKMTEEKLLLSNIPVPETNMNPRYHWITKDLNVMEVFELLGSPVLSNSSMRMRGSGLRDRELKKVIHRIFADIHKMDQERGIQTVFVYLPTVFDTHREVVPKMYRILDYETDWVDYIRELMKENKWQFIDCFTEFEKLDNETMQSYFQPNDGLHYSVKGNQVIADLLSKKFRQLGF